MKTPKLLNCLSYTVLCDFYMTKPKDEDNEGMIGFNGSNLVFLRWFFSYLQMSIHCGNLTFCDFRNPVKRTLVCGIEIKWQYMPGVNLQYNINMEKLLLRKTGDLWMEIVWYCIWCKKRLSLDHHKVVKIHSTIFQLLAGIRSCSKGPDRAVKAWFCLGYDRHWNGLPSAFCQGQNTR